jgi:hypothetical protein
MEIVALAVLVAVFTGGFLLAGRWVKSIPLQLLLGAALGIGICMVIVATFLGIAFTGCMVWAATGGKMNFR